MVIDDTWRWRAVQARDPAADGTFVFGVTTTAIFCRPSCRARAPRREHVVFFPDGQAAQRAGYRPCLRCTPEHDAVPATRLALQAKELLDTSAPWTNATLAEHLGVSRFHLMRAFKKYTGTTLQAYRRQRGTL